MMREHKAADVGELNGEGERIIVDIEGMEIAVFNIGGEYYAVLNYCPHQSGPLCEGSLCGEITTDTDDWGWVYNEKEKFIVCPWHGWTFNVTTGSSVNDPMYSVPTFEVRVRGGEIYVVI